MLNGKPINKMMCVECGWLRLPSEEEKIAALEKEKERGKEE
jgi:hypothetical protein